MDLHDTIVAVASPPGGALRGIVRLSGVDAVAVVQNCFVPDEAVDLATLKRARRITGNLPLSNGLSLPGSLLLWPTNRSYTQQPAAEFHTLGSPPLLQAAVAKFCSAGARLARPGEFTLRAFLAGRIDLTQAEAVLGVIDSHDEQQLQRSLSQLAGGIARPLAELREQLLEVLAHLEAGLDFVDEDIEFISADELQRQVVQGQTLVAELLARMQTQTESAELPRLVLLGRPNAGKSSLLNALAGDTSALVSPIAGTTRDYLVRRLQIGGEWVELIDTAGIDDDIAPGESIPAAAQRMTQLAREHAEVIVLCLDGSRPRDAWETAALQGLSQEPGDQATLLVLTKSDLANPADDTDDHDYIRTSCVTSAGLDQLQQELTRLLAGRHGGDVVPATALRCRDSLSRAAIALERARQAAAHQAGEELVAAELWLALDELGQVVGAVYTDDMLDRLFSRFCIGK